MKVFSWDDLGSVKSYLSQNYIQSTCLTIGGFDGNHLGHQVLFEKVLSKKNEEKSFCAGVVTFARSPRGSKSENFYKGDLSTLSQKIQYFEKQGFDFCLIINFDSEFKKTLGIDFFDRLLGYCNMKFLSVGQDFRCGYKGSMGITEISEYFEKNNLELSICKDVILDNQRISSTLIRDFIYNGEFEKVEKFLGRKYVLQLETSIIKSVSPLENENVDIIINKKNILQVLPKENSFLVKIKNQNFSIQGRLFILENEIYINLNKKFFYENIKNFKSFEVEF